MYLQKYFYHVEFEVNKHTVHPMTPPSFNGCLHSPKE